MPSIPPLLSISLPTHTQRMRVVASTEGNKESPRLVQVGVNVISLIEVNDKEHYFRANVLMVRVFSR